MKDRDRSDCTYEPDDQSNYRDQFPDAYRRARRTGNCSEIPEKDVVFLEPSGALVPEPYVTLVITPLIIRNDPYSSPCAAGVLGTPGDVAVGEVESVVDWRQIPDIDRSRLLFIADKMLILDPEDVLDYDQAEFQETFLLSAAQAQYLTDTIASTRAEVQVLAELIAVGRKDCYWLSVEYEASCAPPGALPPDSYIVEAGRVKSYTSQEDADIQATAIGDASLDCLYGNDPITVTCFEDPANNPDGILNLPAQENESLDQVGTVVVAADTVSAATVAEANALAEALAESRLICVFFSDAITVDCEAIAPEEDPDRYTPLSDLVVEGSIVSVDAGAFTSTESQEDANTIAETFAKSLLDCKWINDKFELRCLLEDDNGVPLPDQDGNPYGVDVTVELETQTVYPNKEATEAAGKYEVTVEAGAFTSYTSKDDAEEQAKAYAESLLICYYCNVAINAKCQTDPDSFDETSEVAVNTFCGADAVAVNALAENLAAVTTRSKTSGQGCRYGNPTITGFCLGPPTGDGMASVPGENITMFDCEGQKYDEDGVVTAGGPYLPEDNPYIGLNLDRSNPTPWACDVPVPIDNTPSFVIVPENTFLATTDDFEGSESAAVESVTKLAKAFAYSLLQCVFTNDRLELFCDSDFNAPSVIAEGEQDPEYQPKYPGDREEPAGRADVSPNAYGSETNPIIVEAGVFESTLSWDDAQRLARDFAFSLADCYYENEDLEVFCDSSFVFDLDPPLNQLQPSPSLNRSTVSDKSRGHVSSPILIAEGVFRSYDSQDKAKFDAASLGIQLLDCFFANYELEVGCGNVYAGWDSQEGDEGEAVTIEAGSVISRVSLEDLAAKLDQLSKSVLACLFTNNRAGLCNLENVCGTEEVISSGEVAAKSVYATDRTTANAIADALACSITICNSPSFVTSINSIISDYGDPTTDGIYEFVFASVEDFYTDPVRITSAQMREAWELDGSPDFFSLQFSISGSAFDQALPTPLVSDPVFDSGPLPEQAYWNVPIVREGKWVSNGGVFFEELSCLNGYLYVTFVKRG